MSLSITTNVQSLASQRALKTHTTEQETLIGRLTAGTRINAAMDDPAGQAIAARMSSGQRGINQALRSISDGSSMLQVAEGAMAGVVDSLQRLRELAVASNSAGKSEQDRAAMQTEAVQILAHLNQVGEQTRFNGETLFSQDQASIGGDAKKRAVLDGLKTGWLSASEKMLKNLFGIEADGVKLTVDLDRTDWTGGVLASVSGLVVPGGDGKYGDVHLNINMAAFSPGETRDGGSAPMYSDRIIAHEMAHAVMSRAMNFDPLPDWFKEAAAELIHGADERVRSSVASGNSIAAIVDGVADGNFKYEGGYIATRYMHDQLKGMGVDGGIKGVMQYLMRNGGATLDTALDAVSGGRITSTSAFLSDFEAHGADFVAAKMNLDNADTGAIGGFDADGGAVFDARKVVANAGDNNAEDGLARFEVVYPELGGATGVRRVQNPGRGERGAGDRAAVFLDERACPRAGRPRSQERRGGAAAGGPGARLRQPAARGGRGVQQPARHGGQRIEHGRRQPGGGQGAHRGRRLRHLGGGADAGADPAAGGVGDAGAGEFAAAGGAVAVALSSEGRIGPRPAPGRRAVRERTTSALRSPRP